MWQRILKAKISPTTTRTNPIIITEKVSWGDCRLDVQAGSPALRIFDNDNETSSDQAQVDERTTAIVFTLRYSVSKDEDDDCTSFYNSTRATILYEADQEPALVMSLLLSGFRKTY
jgi:hypothetical protein